MQVVLRAGLLLGLLGGGATLGGCDPSTGDKTGDTTGGGDDTAAGHNYAADLPDLTADLDTTGCDEVDGQTHPGAATYFYGVYAESDGVWSGEEKWILFANDSLVAADNWIASGADTCQLLWAVETTEAEVSETACASCDVALDVVLTLDVTQTDCPEDLYKSEMSGTASYAVKYTSATESTWYFAGSGSAFGTGYYNDGAMNFLTTKACKWF